MQVIATEETIQRSSELPYNPYYALHYIWLTAPAIDNRKPSLILDMKWPLFKHTAHTL